MAIRLDLDSVEGVALGIADGRLSLAEIEDAAVSMWRRIDGRKRMRILWDLRDARFNLSSDEVRELARFIRESAPARDLKTAFLVLRDLEFGLVRMFEVFREKEGAATAVFRDRQLAIDWLLGTVPQPRTG